MRVFTESEIDRLASRPFWPAATSRDCGEAYLDILRGWQDLMVRDASELEYHGYLHEFAGFFFATGLRHLPLVLSKIRLGSELETDFVVCSDQRSLGFAYEFVEIEVPHAPPFIKKGDPSARLTHALQQVENWRRWLAANREEAKRLFPSDQFTRRDSPNFKFTVVIGNEKNSERWLDRRNELGKRFDVSIRSFEYFTYAVANPYIRPIANQLTSYKQLEIEVLHEMANPFYKALYHQEWRDLRAHPGFDSSVHMLESNSGLIVSSRKPNHKHSQFLELWKKNQPSEPIDYGRFLPVSG